MSFQIAASRFTSTYASNLIYVTLAAAAALVVIKLISPSYSEQSRITLPATDCAKAVGAAASICGDPKLSALQNEMGAPINAAAKMYRNNKEARDALQALLPQMVTMRDYTRGDDGASLGLLMQSQLDFLHALAKPRDGYTGRWIGPMGEIVIRETPHGLFADMRATEPTQQTWTCNAHSPVQTADGVLTIAEGGHTVSESSLGGWTMRIEKNGALLRISEIAPENGDTAIRPYCGYGGGMSGDYFPAK